MGFDKVFGLVCTDLEFSYTQALTKNCICDSSQNMETQGKAFWVHLEKMFGCFYENLNNSLFLSPSWHVVVKPQGSINEQPEDHKEIELMPLHFANTKPCLPFNLMFT